MNRFSRTQLVLLTTIALCLPSRAGMLMMDVSTYNFTDPKRAAEIANWDREDFLKATEKGIGWESEPDTSVDLSLMLQPIPIGHGWRPPGHTRVQVQLNFHDKVGRYFTTYLRYSPDGKNWSTWQVAPYNLEATDNPKVHQFEYNTQISVPVLEMKTYREKQREYEKMDVPWASDEHAVCEWVLENEPDFFENHLPFAGFIQVYVEGSIRGGEHLKSVVVNHTTSTSGMHHPAKDPAIEKKREGPWALWLVKPEAKNPVCGFHKPFANQPVAETDQNE